MLPPPKKKPEDSAELDIVADIFDEILRNSDKKNVSDLKPEDFQAMPTQLLFNIKDYFDLSNIADITDLSTITLGDKLLLAIVGGNLVNFFAIETPTKVKIDKFSSKPPTENIPCSIYFIESVKIELKPSEKEPKHVKSEYYFPEGKQPDPVEELRVCEFTISYKEGKRQNTNFLGEVILACGGAKGIIHLVNFDESFTLNSMKGHANEILDLKFCPPSTINNYGNYLLSSSKDSSIRLWNIRLNQQLAAFRPNSNPHSILISLDWFPNGKHFVSLGTDSTVKIWNAFPENLRKSIDMNEPRKKMKDFVYDEPLFVNSNIHESEETSTNSIQTTGYYVITKDLKGNIIISFPCIKEKSVIIYHEIKTNISKPSWDNKMFLSKIKETLFTGEDKGKIRVILIPRLFLKNSKNSKLSKDYDNYIQLESNKNVKKVILSDKEDVLIALTEDKKLWIQDITMKHNQLFL